MFHWKVGHLAILVAGILQVLTPQLVHLKGHSVQDAIVLRHTGASAIFQPQTRLRVGVSACLDCYSLPRE